MCLIEWVNRPRVGPIHKFAATIGPGFFIPAGATSPSHSSVMNRRGTPSRARKRSTLLGDCSRGFSTSAGLTSCSLLPNPVAWDRVRVAAGKPPSSMPRIRRPKREIVLATDAHGCTRIRRERGAISARCTRPCRGLDDGIDGVRTVFVGWPTERRDRLPASVVSKRQLRASSRPGALPRFPSTRVAILICPALASFLEHVTRLFAVLVDLC
jgi:hypothetical protein